MHQHFSSIGKNVSKKNISLHLHEKSWCPPLLHSAMDWKLNSSPIWPPKSFYILSRSWDTFPIVDNMFWLWWCLFWWCFIIGALVSMAVLVVTVWLFLKDCYFYISNTDHKCEILRVWNTWSWYLDIPRKIWVKDRGRSILGFLKAQESWYISTNINKLQKNQKLNQKKMKKTRNNISKQKP